MSASTRGTFALILVLFATHSVIADVGTAFTYQGSLERGGGLVSEACDFRFRLYGTDVGGSEVGASPQNKTGVAVTSGVFTIESLDFGPAGIDGTARWLAIEVKCPSDAGFIGLSPRVELKPAPHAIHAERAASLLLPYIESVSIAEPMLELTQTGDGPAATFDVGPNHLTDLPAVQITNSGRGPAAILEKVGAIDPEMHPTLEVRNDVGGPAAKVWVQPQPEPPSPIPALEVINETDGPAATFGIDPRFTPAAAIKATNSGLGQAGVFEKLQGVAPDFLPAVQVTNSAQGPAAVLEKVGMIDPEYHPTLEVRNDVGGPAARLVASPTTPGIPALEVRNNGEGPGVTITVAKELGPDPALKATNTGLGPTAVLEKVGAIDPEYHPTLEVRNEVGGSAAELVSQGVGTNPDLPTLKVTNSGLGPAAVLEKVGAVNPEYHPTLEVRNVGVGSGLEVSSGELSVSSAPTLRATNVGVGTAIYASSTTGAAIHAVSGNSDAGYFEGAVNVTGQVGCASLAWGTSALGDDQGGAIELGNSLTMGNNPYIDFHRGVGLAQDYNVRLQNDVDGKLTVDGGLHVTGTLELDQTLTLSGDLSLDIGTLTLDAGDITLSSGDVTLVAGHMAVSNSEPTPTISATNSGTGLAGHFGGIVHVTGTMTKAYTTGTSNQAVPIAYAVVDGTTGLVVAGTPNVSSSWDSANQRYLITLTGETYATTTHITTVTPAVGGAPEALFATTASGSGQLRIRIMSSTTGTTGLQRSFSFIVYKP